MARFSYYKKLSAGQRLIYNQSDKIHRLAVSQPEIFQEGLARLSTVLAAGDQKKTQALTDWLVRGLHQVFSVPHVQVKVLAKRPSHSWGELHGLYELADGPQFPARITVWMRTAKRKEVVAFKTYFRTVIHEVMHHLDYTHLKLADSFHTAGFYQRESSVVRQLMESN